MILWRRKKWKAAESVKRRCIRKELISALLVLFKKVQAGMLLLCQTSSGICMMCGKRITSVKDSRMSLVLIILVITKIIHSANKVSMRQQLWWLIMLYVLSIVEYKRRNFRPIQKFSFFERIKSSICRINLEVSFLEVDFSEYIDESKWWNVKVSDDTTCYRCSSCILRKL